MWSKISKIDMFNNFSKRITILLFVSFIVFVIGVGITLFAFIDGGRYWEFVFLWGVGIAIVGVILLGIDLWLFKKYGQKKAIIIEAVLLFVLYILFQIIIFLLAVNL